MRSLTISVEEGSAATLGRLRMHEPREAQSVTSAESSLSGQVGVSSASMSVDRMFGRLPSRESYQERCDWLKCSACTTITASLNSIRPNEVVLEGVKKMSIRSSYPTENLGTDVPDNTFPHEASPAHGVLLDDCDIVSNREIDRVSD